MSVPSAVELARLDALPDPGFLLVEAMVEGDAEPLILYREGEQVRAWLNVCPHAGRPLDWAPGQFLKRRDGHLVCAVHGAASRWFWSAGWGRGGLGGSSAAPPPY